MSNPLPEDPLDDLITRFVAAVNHYLDKEQLSVDPPVLSTTQNPLADIVRSWLRIKHYFGRAHEAVVNAEPEARERLQNIGTLGSEILMLTDDPHIVGPVTDLVRLASDEQSDITSLVSRMGRATSVWTFLTFVAEASGLVPRNDARRKAISTELDSLTAYYLVQMPPREPGDPAS
ncbi:MAG: hypothetical protein M3Y83_05610 [Actinomycetota bacterium]|nr:hypothetical protein [Actinomycetota bacterium]